MAKIHRIRIALAALALMLVIILLSPPWGKCSTGPSNPNFVQNGFIDLTQWDPEENTVNLDGQWEFYWQELLEPGQLQQIQGIPNTGAPEKNSFIHLPGSWNGKVINSKELQGDGYATYRLNLVTAENSRLGIKLPRIFTSYKLWINEELVASAGTVGTNRQEVTPQYLPQVAFFNAVPGENEIIMQVSNFSHRSGGVLESLELGSEKQILDLRYRNIALELFLFGSIMIIGLYHIALFAFRKKDYSSLYFGLFCILVTIRTLLVGDRFFNYLFPDFSWEATHNIQTLTFYLGVPLILMFFQSTFPKDISGKIVRAVQVGALAFAGLVLLTPARVFTVFNPAYQLFSLLVIIYLGYFFSKTLRKGEIGTIFIVTGALALIIATLNDMFFLSIWMSDQNPAFLRAFITSGNLSSYGQLVFVFTYSLALAQKYSIAFKREERMTEELKEMNENLDMLVKKRTDALELSREQIEQQKAELEVTNQALQLLSLKDPLTGLWNRRHLDETLELEWRRGCRHERPLSLLVVDIDNFKTYNDHYGHHAGDECLAQVAQAIESSFSRASDLAARYGGEEFVVLIPETENSEAVNIAHILKETIEKLQIPHHFSPTGNYITVSIGVATGIPCSDSSPKELFTKADKAMYQAKAEGKNQVNNWGHIKNHSTH